MKKISFLILAAIVVVINYTPLFLGGYMYNEEQAVRRLYPEYTGNKLYEKREDQHKLVVWSDGNQKIVTVVENKWGWLYRARNSVELVRTSQDEPFIRTWSATNHGGNDIYDTILAVETSENESSTIVVTNEPMDEEPVADLERLKALSGIYIEMDVEQGYAVYYGQLPADQTGGFVFRSIDSEGKILSIHR
ncbi:hypothetical protein [Paenibacillus solani]|uniref:Uncharacterized protein n=1 Tax=Paenibacillus solani TaxID=1705565 RepID=A0A0M1P722_9BACL|nr:hypothetical protein [Paenibacillus solani]KOR90115.1 hypothetical protein AM231_13865 [Paenibacillus solani]